MSSNIGGWGCTTGRSGPDCTVGPGSGPDCTVGPGSGPDCTVGPRSGPDCAVGPRSGRDCAVTHSFALESYKAASSATPAVRMVPGVPRGFWEGVLLLGISPELTLLKRKVVFLQGSLHKPMFAGGRVALPFPEREANHIRVAVRCRPFNPKEHSEAWADVHQNILFTVLGFLVVSSFVNIFFFLVFWFCSCLLGGLQKNVSFLLPCQE